MSVEIARFWKTGDTPKARSLVHKFGIGASVSECGASVPEGSELYAEEDAPASLGPPSRCKRCFNGAAGAIGGPIASASIIPDEKAGSHPGPSHLSPEAIALSGELADAMAESERVEAALGPGLYPGLPFDVYQRIDAASNTSLGWLKRSPAHLKAFRDDPPTFIDPTSIGRGLHSLLFDGREAFEATYRAGPVDDKRLKAWKEWEAGLEPGVIAMWPSHYAAVLAMRERILDYPAARLVIESATQHELSVVWIDVETGVACKGRPDGIAPSLGVVLDLKSAEDASPNAFTRSIYNYSYYRQGSMYQRAVQAWLSEVDWKYHVIIAQEKKPPYAVAVYQIEDAALFAGHEEIDNLLRRYKVCVERDEWPGYGEGFQSISLPPYAWSQLEREHQEAM